MGHEHHTAQQPAQTAAAHPPDRRPRYPPPVSVIICAKNERENIRRFLPLVLEQQYPDYEVIVVNDGSVDDTEQTIVELQKLYPHLYLTNIPEHTRIISHKKLAITIGAKAAKNEILIFTDADCRPWTPHWISDIVHTYTPDTQYVLGYGGYYRNHTIIGHLTAYDTITSAIQFLGMAAHRHPYMGVGRNMSYRRSTFFDNKGFAGLLHIASGDDDLLINHFATAANTAVCPSIDAKTISIPKTSFSDWYYQKLRHLSASDDYTRRSKLLISVEPTVRGIFWLSAIALLTLCSSYPYAILVAICALTLKLLTQTLIVNTVARQYDEHTFNPLSIILYDILLPLITLYIVLIGKHITKHRRWK